MNAQPKLQRSRWMLTAGLLMLTGLAYAQAPIQDPLDRPISKQALRTLSAIPIQHNGRLKPFDSFARETLKQITGADRVGKANPVETVLNILSQPERWQEEPLLSVPFAPLREPLGLGEKTTHVAYNELVSTKKLMRMLPAIVEKQRQDEKMTMLENETMDLYGRFFESSQLFNHDFALVPPAQKDQFNWLPILKPQGHAPQQREVISEAWGSLIEGLREGTSGEIDVAAQQLADTLSAVAPEGVAPAAWRINLELLYNQFGPFRVTRIIYLLAAIGLWLNLAGKRPAAGQFGIRLLWIAFLLHGIGIVARVVLGERPPVSNFYETMLWIPFVAVAATLIFERIYRSGLFGLGASILSAVILLLADHLPLDSSISPVVAVLRSNMWLTIHVLTIVGSYAPITLAAVLAHIYGVLFAQNKQNHPAFVPLETFIYRAIQVGVVMLAAGIMLGAVWANASWGRYWGWDPKETWALITLLWFVAVLHGRFAGWLKPIGVALGTIFGFFLLLVTYYGVSFYLVGLHSYAGGNAKPLPPLLIGYLIAEVLFMAWIGLSMRAQKQA